MAEWTEVVEGDKTFYINDEYGNVVKVAEDIYISLMPKVLKFGPFKNLEDAKIALVHQIKTVNEFVEDLNQKITK